MKLATIRTHEHGTGSTRAVRLEVLPDGRGVLVDLGYADLGALFAEADWQARAASTTAAGGAVTYDLEGADFAPVVPTPSKVICVGHNYKGHIQEMGRELPSYPTLFPKFAETLLGANDDVTRPAETDALDWEVELAIVVGKQVRRAGDAEAEAAIAGFTVMNDVSVRDWQFRTIEWTQGKIWEATTPVGPFVTTPDEVGGVRPALEVRTVVDGEVMQRDNTGDLLFDPVFLVSYISTMITLQPGDIIATGTPAGVGHARDPKVYLVGGETVVTEIEGLGACTNRIVRDA
ncbi:fumarylacetoacetate hydrolase family protein [Dactylosporangium sp. NPDC051484]|uniref:fumarylacetoacetate hydrolase family protein n=1 Tax=Dactylosporangium sp. NPDC051484 TaxID=3154942 RepID=UPI00344B33BE